MPQKQQAPAGRICTHHPLQRGERREKSGEGREKRGEGGEESGKRREEREKRREERKDHSRQGWSWIPPDPKGGSAMIQAQNLSNPNSCCLLGRKMKMFSSHRMKY